MFEELIEKLDYFQQKKAALDLRYAAIANVVISAAATLERESRRIESKLLAARQAGGSMQAIYEERQTVLQANPVPDYRAETEALKKEYGDINSEIGVYMPELDQIETQFRELKGSIIGLKQGVSFGPTYTIDNQRSAAESWYSFLKKL